MGAVPSEIVFTSCGSESNNHAILGAARARRARGNHIVTSAIEHPAVLQVCRFLETEGWEITVLPVDGQGTVDPEAVADAITGSTVLVSVMHANNEVGTIQDIRAMADMAHERGVLVHTDCAQSVGKIDVHVDELGVDLLTVAGHKLYAPKGVGALYIRTGVEIPPLILGGGQEDGRRSGTENVIHVVGLGKACEIAHGELESGARHLCDMRDRLQAGLAGIWPALRINGNPDRRLPNTVSASFTFLPADAILERLVNVVASAGAACHADQVKMSHVLEAMGLDPEVAKGTIRFSVGRFTTPEEVDAAVGEMAAVIEELGEQGR